MKKIKELKIIIDALKEKREKLNISIDELNEKATAERKEIFETLFALELATYNDVSLVASYGSIYFKIGHKEIGSLHKREWPKDDKSFYFNTYATTIEDEFEYRRLIFNGKIAEKIFYNQEAIRAGFDIKFSMGFFLEELTTEKYTIEREIANKESEVCKAKKEDVMEKLMGEGMEVDTKDGFELGKGWSAYQVKKVRVTKSTKSGKTVDLEIISNDWGWEKDEAGLDVRVQKDDRVSSVEGIKMDYVMGNFNSVIYKH